MQETVSYDILEVKTSRLLGSCTSDQLVYFSDSVDAETPHC